MRQVGTAGSAFLILLALGACASAEVRRPVMDVPPGSYVLVEPQSDVYNAVTINERAWAVRMGDEVFTGAQWVDAEGRLHLVNDTGPCAGQQSVWTYSYSGGRITLDRVEDECTARPEGQPSHMVYQRQP